MSEFSFSRPAAIEIRTDMQDHIEALEGENKALREVLLANLALIHKAQDILCEQLMGPPRGLTDHNALNGLHSVFDGPEQRDAQGRARALLAKGLNDE